MNFDTLQDNDGAPFGALTDRELEVLLLTAENHSANQIAILLDVRPHSVTRYRARICRKLGVSSMLAAIKLVWETQTSSDLNDARFQYERVLPALIGAYIIAPVLRHPDWFGLLVRLRTGKTYTMWIDRDRDADTGGWIHLARDFSQ